MARYRGTVDAPHSAEEVWAYLADLRSIGEWDPSVEMVTLTSGEPRTTTARYDLEVRFRNSTLALPYRTVEVDPPHRVVFAAENESVSVRDEARIDPAGAETSTVTWSANLELRGFRKVFDLPLRLLFNRLGENARKGLAERLSEPTLEAPVEEVQA